MSADAIAKLESIVTTALALANQFEQVKARIAELTAAGQQAQSSSAARQIVQQLWDASEQANTLYDQASDLDVDTMALVDEAIAYINSLRDTFDATVYADGGNLADVADSAARDLENWADDVDAALSAGRAARTPAFVYL